MLHKIELFSKSVFPKVMAWKTGGQEKELKKEYVKHLQDQLGIILPNVLHSCSNQIQQAAHS